MSEKSAEEAETPTYNACIQTFEPPFWWKFWKALGFGRPNEDYFEDIADDDRDWVPGRIAITTVAHIDWKDRLRILISGRMMVATSVKTDVMVRRHIARAAVRVLAPVDKGPF